jgi:hypothetical protein
MAEDERRRLTESMKRDTLLLLAEEPLKWSLENAMADMIDLECRHHPERSMDENLKNVRETFRTSLFLLYREG